MGELDIPDTGEGKGRKRRQRGAGRVPTALGSMGMAIQRGKARIGIRRQNRLPDRSKGLDTKADE